MRLDGNLTSRFDAKGPHLHNGCANDAVSAMADGAPKRAWLVPSLVIGLLAMQGGISGTAVYFATSDPSVAIEPDYYQKAVRWDREKELAIAQASLGWSLTCRFGPAVDDDGRRMLTCELTDRDGRPLPDAHIEITAFHTARANERIHWTLRDAGDGTYQSLVRTARPGLWELRAAVRCSGRTFTKTHVCDVDPPQAGDGRP